MIDTIKKTYTIALAGNPNTGKSTIFNALTGMHQHTGNWPGKTVARAEGYYEFGKNRFQIVDLPGTYSLLSTSLDEEIARDFILFGKPDAVGVILDTTRLERNLNLALQIMEISSNIVICLNLMDEAKRHGISVDAEKLSTELGVPVVTASARFGKGIGEFQAKIAEVALGKITPKPRILFNPPQVLVAPVQEIENEINTLYPQLPNKRWIALRLLDGDDRVMQALQSGELETLAEKQKETPDVLPT